MNIVIRALEQCGISPKVKVPSVVLAALGVVSLAVALIFEDVEGTWTEVGLALLASSGVTFGAGYAANPGTVKVSGQEAGDAGKLYRREQEEPYQSARELGYSVVEAILIVFLVAVVLIVLFRLL